MQLDGGWSMVIDKHMSILLYLQTARIKWLRDIGMFVILLSISLYTHGQETSQDIRIAQLEKQVSSLEARLRNVDQDMYEKELEKRRAEDLDYILKHVLEETAKQYKKMNTLALGGNENGQFYLKSADGNFLMNIHGFVQTQYDLNQQNSRSGNRLGDTQMGFQIRRARLWIDGHICDPRFGYRFQMQSSTPNNGEVFFQEAFASYFLNDDFKVMIGLMKLPFLRTQLTPAFGLLAVDRAPATYFFNLERSTQIQLQWFGSENVRLYASISNGTRRTEELIPPRGFFTIGNDPANLAITGRFDWRVFGTWDQQYMNVAWPGTPNTLIVGAAVNYQLANQSVSDAMDPVPGNANYFTYTADATLDSNGWHLSGVFFGAHTREATLDLEDRDFYGALIQGAYLFEGKVQPFMRLEWMHPDIEGQNDPLGLTWGVNIYFKKQKFKFTTDLVWFFEGDAFNALDVNPFTEPVFIPLYGLGVANGSFSDNNLIAIRTQLQLKF